MERYICIVLVLLFSTTAMPAWSQNYVGMSAGQGNMSISGDDRDLAGKVFGGGKGPDGVGYEVGYIDLGQYAAPARPDGEISIDAEALYTALVGALPIGGAGQVYAKAGLSFWGVDAESTGGVPISGRDTGQNLMFGLGGDIALAPNLALRLELERYNNVADGLGLTNHFAFNGENVDVWSVGATLGF